MTDAVKFGRLSVIAEAPSLKDARGNAVRMWRCVCACGMKKVIRAAKIKNGHTKSCGCLAREKIGALRRTHGLSKTPTWHIWRGMLERCYGEYATSYPRYGARGVTVCEEWRSSFANFLRDMGARPSGKTLDRINNDGNYEPGNCRWATPSEQAFNRRKAGA